MGPWIDEKIADNETLVSEFETACRAGDYEFSDCYKSEILRRFASIQKESEELKHFKQELSHVTTSLSLSRADANSWKEELERLSNQGEAARLREELEDQRARANIAHANAEAKSARITELHTEIARLREALERICKLLEQDRWHGTKYIIWKLATEALSTHTEDKEIPNCPKCSGVLEETRNEDYFCRTCGDSYGMWGDGSLIKPSTEGTGVQKVRELLEHENTTFDYRCGIKETLKALGITIPGITDGGEQA